MLVNWINSLQIGVEKNETTIQFPIGYWSSIDNIPPNENRNPASVRLQSSKRNRNIEKKKHAKTYSEPSQKKLRKIHLKLNDNVPHYFPMFIQKLYEV